MQAVPNASVWTFQRLSALPATLVAGAVLLPGLALTWAAVMLVQQKVWVMALGLVLSVGLALVIGLLAGARRRAELLAHAMTAELELLARVARSTGNSVFSTDRQLRILWVNEGFSRVTGYSAEEAIGRLPGELFHSPASDPATERELAEAAAAGRGCRVEVLQRHRQGHDYWMAVELQPVRDAGGELQGFIDIGTDISARRAMEAELRASEAMLDRAGRLAGVGAWELELDAALQPARLRWSAQCLQIHDLEPGQQPDFEAALGFFAEEGRHQLREAVRLAAEQGRAWDLELPLTTALGRFVWVRLVGEALVPAPHEHPLGSGGPVVPGGPGGAVRRLVGSMQDVTARRALSEAMQRSNTVLQSVVDHLPCGLSVYDSDLRLIAFNEQFRQLLRLPDALFEPCLPSFTDVVRHNLASGEYGHGAAAEERARRALEFAGAPRHETFERRRPDGSTLELRAAPMPGGGFLTLYFDLSERQQAQAAVERSELLLRGAIDAIDEAFVLFDPQDRLVFCNEKYRSAYANVADLLLPGIPFERIVRARAERGSHAAALGRIDAWVAERVALHQSGEVKRVQQGDDGRWLRIIERRMPDGHIVGFRIDITDLMHATEAAQKASVAKGQFLANMSHEIRTPMNAVLGMLRLLQKTPLDGRQQDYVSKTEGAARSLLGLLNDILDYSKVEAGKMSLDPHPARIDELMRDLSVILGANVGHKPVELLFDIDPALPRCVIVDAMRLQQVLINLAGNAIKFTERGEVRLSLRVGERSDADLELEVEVLDTGIGIAAE
ncbi:MAG: PAS-domain containing protein, partial [Burkholderiaceae bacterium]